MFKSGFSVKNLFTEIAFFEIVDFHLNNILFSLYLLLFIQFSMCCDPKPPLWIGGLKWTRTTDLTLIRRAL